MTFTQAARSSTLLRPQSNSLSSRGTNDYPANCSVTLRRHFEATTCERSVNAGISSARNFRPQQNEACFRQSGPTVWSVYRGRLSGTGGILRTSRSGAPPCVSSTGGVLDEAQELEAERALDISPELEYAQIQLAGRQLVLVQPRDVDEVIDMYIAQGRLDRDPYWCRLWPSAIALANEILAHPELVAGCRVCDLGAGLGLAGLAAALAGAREVVLLDREALALHCALLTAGANIANLRSNLSDFTSASRIKHFSALEHAPDPATSHPFSSSSSSSPSSPSTRPEEACSSSLSSPKGESGQQVSAASREGSMLPGLHPQLEYRGEIFDWSNPDAWGEFDVVLACDVLYEKPAVGLIASLAPRLLAASHGSRLLVSDPLERNPKNRDSFIDRIGRDSPQRAGMKLAKMERHTPLMDGARHQVEVMHFL